MHTTTPRLHASLTDDLPPDRLSGSASPLAWHELGRIRAAAHHARRALPGPIGELAARELTAYANLGYLGGPDALVPELARHILTLPAQPSHRRPSPATA